MLNLKRTSYIFIAIGLFLTLLLAYLEILPRLSQYRMKPYWKKVVNSNIKLLKVEKTGPDKNQLGVLKIPKLNLEQVVIYDATIPNLAIAPSLIKTTAYPGTIGNAAIAGHRVSHGFPFRNIHLLKKGDKIIFSNSSGTLVYRVTKKFKILPSDLTVLKQTPFPQITLLACDPPFSARYRLAVVAKAALFSK